MLTPGEMESAGASLGVTAPPGYEIVGELGRGGMGVVYKARQVKLNRLVALKMILSGGHAGEQERSRFLAEGEAIASIKHPGIVQIFDFGTHEELPFFALEFCSGGSRAGKLNGTPLEAREAARIVEQVARAMHAAHERGIIHRDLKPANVLLGEDGQPRVTDFGLARRVSGGSGLTQTGAVMGTPSYMAPEQAEGKKDIGPAADVYALGAILYECLTGRPPFRAATTFDTLLQVIGDEPAPPTQLNAKAPRDLETICLKCLRKEPVQRYSTAEALADDLARWQRGEPIQARPVRLRERSVKWARRRPAVAGLLAGIVLLTAAALIAITALYRNAAHEADRARQAEEQAEGDRDDAREQARLARAAEARKANEQTRIAKGAEKKAKEQEGLARLAEKNVREQEGRTRQQKERAEEQLDRAEHLLYASQIQAAQRAWEAGNRAMAWDYLESTRWDFRDVEYRYLFTLFNHNHVTLKGDTDFVSSVAYSPDGKRIVSGSRDKTVKVWDALTGKDLLTLKGHTADVTSVAISADGKRIVSGSRDNTVKVWDALTGKDLLTLKGHTNGVSSVAVSPDGKRIVSGGDDSGGDITVKVWDAGTGQNLLTLKGGTRPPCAA